METLIERHSSGFSYQVTDNLADEEPLEIRLSFDGNIKPLSITMRTPGHDKELAIGFLRTEGILQSKNEIKNVVQCATNVIRIELAEPPDLKHIERHFYTTSSCGVCGKTSLEALEVKGTPFGLSGPLIERTALSKAPQKLREAQSAFEKTGGIHASGLFSQGGDLAAIREDVGRHNALDKIIGWGFLENRSFQDHFLLVSGRASFELMQKALMGGISFLAAIGAPSSLALGVAQKFDMTLVGFLKEDRFNLYHGNWRVR